MGAKTLIDHEKPLRIVCLVEDIRRHITFGYSVRGACLAVGVAPSTGRRWLDQAREIEDISRLRRSPIETDPTDRPF
jgi:transposase-like protein